MKPHFRSTQWFFFTNRRVCKQPSPLLIFGARLHLINCIQPQQAAKAGCGCHACFVGSMAAVKPHSHDTRSNLSAMQCNPASWDTAPCRRRSLAVQICEVTSAHRHKHREAFRNATACRALAQRSEQVSDHQVYAPNIGGLCKGQSAHAAAGPAAGGLKGPPRAMVRPLVSQCPLQLQRHSSHIAHWRQAAHSTPPRTIATPIWPTLEAPVDHTHVP